MLGKHMYTALADEAVNHQSEELQTGVASVLVIDGRLHWDPTTQHLRQTRERNSVTRL